MLLLETHPHDRLHPLTNNLLIYLEIPTTTHRVYPVATSAPAPYGPAKVSAFSFHAAFGPSAGVQNSERSPKRSEGDESRVSSRWALAEPTAERRCQPRVETPPKKQRSLGAPERLLASSGRRMESPATGQLRSKQVGLLPSTPMSATLHTVHLCYYPSVNADNTPPPAQLSRSRTSHEGPQTAPSTPPTAPTEAGPASWRLRPLQNAPQKPAGQSLSRTGSALRDSTSTASRTSAGDPSLRPDAPTSHPTQPTPPPPQEIVAAD